MLARSPVPTTSPANASPRSNFHGFHYAPAPSPRYSCPRAPAVAQSRRPSGSSASTIVDPPATQPRRHVVADAAPQNSSIEPVNSANSALLSTAPSTETKHDPSTSQETMAVPEEGPAVAGQPQAKINKEVPSGAKQRTGAPTVPISPSKRRISQEPGSERTSAPEPSQNPSKEAKRAKPDTAPPKVLPLRYELCPVEDLVVLIAHMLGELIETNDTFALRSGHLTRFHSRTAPGISVLDYLHRLAKHATLTPPLLLSMVYYIDRLCALYPDFTINTLTVHRFLITAATVAAKGLSDAFWNNSTYARVGGVKVAELKLLELEFLHRVDWKIVPNPEVLVAYYTGLVDRCPGYVLEGTEDGGDANDSDSMDDGDELEDERTPGEDQRPVNAGETAGEQG